jgi:hypothetical protein
MDFLVNAAQVNCQKLSGSAAIIARVQTVPTRSRHESLNQFQHLVYAKHATVINASKTPAGRQPVIE